MSGFTFEKLMTVVNNLVTFILQMGALASFVVMIYYGIRMIIAGNDATAYSNARKGFNWALVGTLVIFGVYGIIATIQGAVDSAGML